MIVERRIKPSAPGARLIKLSAGSVNRRSERTTFHRHALQFRFGNPKRRSLSFLNRVPLPDDPPRFPENLPRHIRVCCFANFLSQYRIIGAGSARRIDSASNYAHATGTEAISGAWLLTGRDTIKSSGEFCGENLRCPPNAGSSQTMDKKRTKRHHC